VWFGGPVGFDVKRNTPTPFVNNTDIMSSVQRYTKCKRCNHLRLGSSSICDACSKPITKHEHHVMHTHEIEHNYVPYTKHAFSSTVRAFLGFTLIITCVLALAWVLFAIMG
jgi:hypothetical protein